MFGKQDLAQEALTRDGTGASEGKHKPGITPNSSGKILIEVNVSKQNMHGDEIGQIIREIFDLNNRDLEVEKVVMPIGEDTWQIRRANHSEIEDAGSAEFRDTLAQDRRKSRLQQNRMKIAKRSVLCGVKMFQSLSRSRQSSRRRLGRKRSELADMGKLDVAEVHSSPAITNLLSQLYPNPYKLFNLFEISDNATDTRTIPDSSESCKIQFRANNKLSIKESIVEQETSSLCKSTVHAAAETVLKRCNGRTGKKAAVFGKEETIDDPVQFTVSAMPEKAISQKLKRKIVPEPVPAAVNKSDSIKTNGCNIVKQEGVCVTSSIRQRSKMTSTESKSPKKRMTNSSNGAAEKTESEKAHSVRQKISPAAKEKVPLSTIHPMSIQKATSSYDGKIERVKGSEQEKIDLSEKSLDKAKKKVLPDKNKCVVKYLKLIKDMYEEEERQLQCQINHARDFAIDQIDKPEGKEVKLEQNRKNDQSFTSAPEGMSRFCKSQIHDTKQRKSSDKIKKRPICEGQVPELSKVPARLRPAVISNPAEQSGSRLAQSGDNLKIISENFPNFNSCNGTQCGISRIIQTETYMVNRRKHMEQIPEGLQGLPANVMNTVHETNRKIDLLIRQIDNSMNWLSRSEKTDSGSITSVMKQAKILSDELEKDLSPSRPENKNTPCRREDPPLNQSYHSLRIVPIENGVGSFHISADSLLNTRNQEYVWHDMFRPTYLVNLLFKNDKRLRSNCSFNFLNCTSSGISTPQSREDERSERGLISERNFTLRTEVPELAVAPASTLISVESSNELGSFIENRGRYECESSDSFKIRRKRDSSKVSLAEVKTALENEELILTQSRSLGIKIEKPFLTSLSINAVALNEILPNLKPVIIQEITWNFYLPAPLPVTRVLYRNERNLVFTTMEASVLHVARNVSFLKLALMSVVQIIEQEPKEQSSIIISLHKCSSFVKNNNGLDESGKACKFVVLPSDIHFTEQSSGNVALSEDDFAEIKVLKKAEAGGLKEDSRDVPFYWDSFPSESSTEVFDRKKPGIKRIETLLRRTSKNSLTWYHPLPDPYESNPDTNHADDSKPKNVCAFRTGPSREEELLYSKIKDWDRGKIKLDEGSSPPILRYLSSETSDTSLDEKESKQSKKPSNVDLPLFPELKKSSENADRKEEPQIEEDKPVTRAPDRECNKDCSSTSSFKSSNDCSDTSDFFDLGFPKKKAKRSHFLDRLFHELRSFRKSLAKIRGPKRRNVQEEQRDSNEFQDALSEVNEDEKGGREKQKVDEAVAVNTTCIDEIAIPASYAMPRKIFKTSFRGKESVTELMIDLKDVSISEVSDISVEKRKLSTDHTKISIVISKQADKICCASQANKPDDTCEESELPSPEGSYHSLKPEKANCLGWTKEERNDSDDDIDDEDFKSIDSGKSLEKMPIQKFENDGVVRSDVMEPRKTFPSYGKHKFDFYKKMDNGTSSFVDKGTFFSGRYGKQLAPLRKAITDMQLRVRNIQKNSFYTSDEYYERALRMAKMSAGYCQSCKSKTVIPEDPLGIYQKLIPRSFTRSPYLKQRKYYFKTTSSTNSSFYSIHSSSSDVNDRFCHLNSSSSIITNGLNRGRGPVLRGLLDTTHFDLSKPGEIFIAQSYCPQLRRPYSELLKKRASSVRRKGVNRGTVHRNFRNMSKNRDGKRRMDLYEKRRSKNSRKSGKLDSGCLGVYLVY